jgi:two-component system, OmpR family, KDP operon response regulator KdpE
MNKARVNALVVDNELATRRLLRSNLSVRGFRVVEVAEGQAALDLIMREPPELVILDLTLPDIDGIELLRRIRALSHVPVVVLSSNDRVRVKVEALELGANDYVTKPFNMDEFVARLHAALRHGLHQRAECPAFRSGDMTIDLVRRRVELNGRNVKLSGTEFAVLQFLVKHAGKVLTHDQILSEIWGGRKDIEHLRVYIRLLRQKLEADPRNPRYLVTEHGVGYHLGTGD